VPYRRHNRRKNGTLIAADTAVFAENFLKVGIIPGDGGAWLLPRAIGLSRAAQMTFTGRPIDAKQGLVSEIVPGQDLMPTAANLADEIASNPPRQIRMAKRLLREGMHMGLENILEMSAAFQAVSHHTADHDEAVQAILEKRQPHFVGE
jgi:enoyl-CoA hydratase/carnithine racemase